MSDKQPPKPGRVSLVGAGPGDPGLMTLRGAELLAQAETVIYDQLAAPELLELAPPGCRRIYAGKTGARHALRQEEINALLIAEARAGRTVVRLKGGDPYIFGRGAEEALALEAAGAPFEVVSGVSSTSAAAAYAGIPLTHRDVNSQAVLMTAREKAGRETSAHDWAALAKMGVISAVMGAAGAAELRDKLLAAGKDPQTPAAMIQRGTTVRQRVVEAPLGRLPEAAAEAGLGAPALLVIGEVVKLRAKLNWFEKRPLWGRRVLVTRTRAQAGRLSAALRTLGAEVIERPVFRLEEIRPNPVLEAALDDLRAFDWLALTSPNGADFFLRRLFERGQDARALGGLKIAVIGTGTAAALEPYGLKADLTPKAFVAEALLETLKPHGPARCLLARAEQGRDALPEGLKSWGWRTTDIPLYRTLPADWSAEDLFFHGPERPDLTTVTSSSSAEGLAALVPPEERQFFPTAAIGPVAARTARELGFPVLAESPRATVPDLVETIAACLRADSKRSLEETRP
ncbi:MAG: uroporphyrinogen-III C-methyltransferase [Deltaproteobacteria bacterium]|jgi:uroporphyrinogen III methyltransferase/synthase|nr:uroporphyrinogen-III C-methyltransferase [Deltaproteobacteria bacterium]